MSKILARLPVERLKGKPYDRAGEPYNLKQNDIGQSSATGSADAIENPDV